MLKQKRLMVSLCGLALSSLFVINNKSVVHADAINNNQASAITWDSDSNDSQAVKTEQASILKIEDNLQSVNEQIVNEHIVSENTINNKANVKTNVVQSSNSAKPLVNNASDSASFVNTKIANVDSSTALTPVVINNSVVHVHFVNSEGKPAYGATDYDINVNQTKSGSYQVPTGYYLNNPNGKYNLAYASSLVAHTSFSLSGLRTNIYDSTANDTSRQYWGDAGDLAGLDPNSEYVIGTNGAQGLLTGFNALMGQHVFKLTNGLSISNIDDVAAGNHTNFEVNMRDRAWILQHTQDMGSVDKWPSLSQLLTETYNNEANNQSNGYNGYNITLICLSPNTTYSTNVTKQQFTDNSGNVQSVDGNTVNVVVTKPQNVDPATDTRMISSATRTIQINFPGSIPPSYKNIVNDKGILTQTVTFTRRGQEDALTGNLINSTLTPWKSDNKDPNFIGFPERTLPRIPGYTLSIKPA